jgi:hypothetical protein
MVSAVSVEGSTTPCLVAAAVAGSVVADTNADALSASVNATIVDYRCPPEETFLLGNYLETVLTLCGDDTVVEFLRKKA